MSDHNLQYQSGFGNELWSEAVPGALVHGQNSPQRPPLGLYAEQLSGTAFTEPRGANRRTWMYRIMPTAVHRPFVRIDDGTLLSAPIAGVADPNRMRWDPMPAPTAAVDFLDGLYTVAGNGDVLTRNGIAIHLYAATTSMSDRYFSNADGEMLIVPQAGVLTIRTELGILRVEPGEIAVIGRGIKFAVDITDALVSGYVCENYGAYFELPELGPIGANGLAHARHFQHPVAAYEDSSRDVQWVNKFGGHLWATDLDHSPLDVVAWHGSHTAYKYDLSLFNVMGTLGWDHPDPSIFTVLTSVSERPGQANVDFVAFPPRWVVGEHTFRPPHFHRNVMTEFMGLIHGIHDSKAEGFVPGGASLHNMFGAHGPDLQTFDAGSNAELTPQKFDNSLAFMFETRWPLVVTDFALAAAHRQDDYDGVWSGLRRNFQP